MLNGLKPVLVEGQAGRKLSRDRAAATMVGALASLSRAETPLPVEVERITVTEEDLRPVLAQTRLALSAPIRLELGKTWWRLRQARIAELLELPRDGSRKLAIGGRRAEAWFERFGGRVGRPPTDAGFRSTSDGQVVITPSSDGLKLDVPATSREILAAALAPGARRVGDVVVAKHSPELTTERARGLGISRVLSSYSTFYSGTADRIQNLQRAVQLLDGTLVAPGGTFSLNEAVGPRTIERGFRSAPVIIGDEYEEDVGGGVSQVATTVFNAAWEAGVKVLERNPHSLYISRYQLGRDATVNYPDLDLKFRNDTGKWMVVLGASGQNGIAITLAGTPTGRRVVSEPGPLVGDRQAAGEARQGSDAHRRHGGRRGDRLVAAVGHGHAHRLQQGRQRALRRVVAHELPRREARDPRRHEEEGAEADAHDVDAHHDDADHADDPDDAQPPPPPPPKP